MVKPRIRSRTRLAAVAALGALVLTACADGGEEAGQQQEGPPPPVTLATVAPTSVDVEQTYAGRVHGGREVQVRARVQGMLEERLYREGQPVERGEHLFLIDPAPFEARL